MKYINIIFLLLISNVIVAMEAERKSLAFFFGIDDRFTQHKDIAHNIAQHYFSDKQWWYVDKDLEHQGIVQSACFNKAGTEVLTTGRKAHTVGGGELCIWDSNTGTEIFNGVETPDITAAEFNQAGTKMLVMSAGRQNVVIYEWDKNVPMCNPERATFYGDFVCFNKTETEALIRSFDGAVRIKDMSTGTELLRVQNKSRLVSAYFNENETEIITMANNGVLQVWGRDSGIELLNSVHNFVGKSAHFNTQGTELLVYGAFPTAYILDRKNGKIVMELKHPTNICFARFNREGNEIVTVTCAQKIRIWDRIHKKVIAKWYYGGACYPHYTTFPKWNNEETKIIIGLDKIARIWARYDNYTLPQILLKRLLHVWLQLQKPNKEIDSSEKLLDCVAGMLLCNYNELYTTWASFPEHMQTAMWLSMYKKIHKYGK